MNSHPTLVSWAVYLLLNLTLLGASLALGVTIAFRFIPTSLPRARYFITLAAFCAASLLPILATMGITTKPPSILTPPEAASHATTSDHASLTDLAPIIEPALTAPESFRHWLPDFARRVNEHPLAAVLLWLWLSVAILLLGRELIGHLSLWRARRQWELASATLQQALNWPSHIPLYLHQHSGPSTVGWLRPAVVLPQRLWSDLPSTAISQVAQHELAHARWRDPLVNALLRIVRAALWPSLPLWFLARDIQAEREAAADRAAINPAGSSADANRMAADYAASLVLLAQWPKPGAYHHTGTQLGGVAGLEDRVRRLLRTSVRLTRARLVLGSLALLAGVLGMAFLPITAQPFKTASAAPTQSAPDQVQAGAPAIAQRNMRSEAAREAPDAAATSKSGTPQAADTAPLPEHTPETGDRPNDLETVSGPADSPPERPTPPSDYARLIEKLNRDPDFLLSAIDPHDAPLVITHTLVKQVTSEERALLNTRGRTDLAPRSDLRRQSVQYASYTTLPRVTVVNRSNRRITGFALGFKKRDGTESQVVIGENTLSLEPGASFTYRAKWPGVNVSIPGTADDNAILVVGVEFDDGSIWGYFPFSKSKEREK